MQKSELANNFGKVKNKKQQQAKIQGKKKGDLSCINSTENILISSWNVEYIQLKLAALNIAVSTLNYALNIVYYLCSWFLFLHGTDLILIFLHNFTVHSHSSSSMWQYKLKISIPFFINTVNNQVLLPFVNILFGIVSPSSAVL